MPHYRTSSRHQHIKDGHCSFTAFNGNQHTELSYSNMNSLQWLASKISQYYAKLNNKTKIVAANFIRFWLLRAWASSWKLETSTLAAKYYVDEDHLKRSFFPGSEATWSQRTGSESTCLEIDVFVYALIAVHDTTGSGCSVPMETAYNCNWKYKCNFVFTVTIISLFTILYSAFVVCFC